MASNATSSLSLSFLARHCRSFLAWWGSELASLVPESLRQWWRGSSRLVVLSFDGSQAVFTRIRGHQITPVHTVDLASGDLSLHTGEIGRRLLQAIGGKYHLVLSIPADQVLRRTVNLPLAVEENLRQALAFELDRYTPFMPDQVYFDCRIAGRDVARKRLSVELATVPKATVDQGVARALAAGLTVDGAIPANDLLKPAGERHDLLPARKRKATGHLWWRTAMVAFSLVLLAMLLAVPIWQKRAAAIALLEPLYKVKAEAEQVDASRDRLKKLTEEHNFLHNRKWESYSTLRVLEELSKLLPDDAFAIQFDFDGASVQIQGETASSVNLLERLESSSMFKDVVFKSQLTKIQGTRLDRFHISATLEPESRLRPPGPPPNGSPAAAPLPQGLPASGAETQGAAAAKLASKP